MILCSTCRCQPIAGQNNQDCLGLPNRNSIYNYPFEFASTSSFSSQTNFIVLDTVIAPGSQVCMEPLQHLSCIISSPPCNRESDLPLEICKDSCLAFNMLMSGATCHDFNQKISMLNVLSFGELASLYMQFDCNDTSTYFFGSADTVFFDGNCTNLFSALLQGWFLMVICTKIRNKICMFCVSGK